MSFKEELGVLRKLAESVADNINEENIPKACIKLGMLLQEIYVLQVTFLSEEDAQECAEDGIKEKDKISARNEKVEEFFKILKGLRNG